ncbi:MAG: DUF1559 domain-containing protein [Capsulimonadaceae bacterium]|nr:DUF1559 domain-containing protein [Capsulimonadaceae bacterium]
MPSKQNVGFTLIELLIVIAIIAIIAAVLFPVFSSAREKARQSACISNEKQIGMAVMQYTQDYDEVFPCEATSGGNVALFDIIEAYYSGRGLAVNPLLICPSATDIYRLSWSDRAVSYVLNAVYWNQPSLGGIFGYPIATIQDPAGTVWLGDGGALNSRSSTLNDFQVPCLPSGQSGCSLVIDTTGPVPKLGDGSASNGQGAFEARHSGGCVVDFVDGHAKWLSIQQLAVKNSAGNYPYFTTIAD